MPAVYASDSHGLTKVPSDPLDETKRLNTCFGGLSQGKHIVPEGWTSDRPGITHRNQTTASECAAEGGSPGWLPRLDTPVRNTIWA